MTKSRITILTVFAVVSAALLAVGGVFDLAVSREFFCGSDHILALIGAFFGKLPAYLLLATSFFILLAYVRNNMEKYNKAWAIVLMIGYSLFIAAAFVLSVYSALEDITSKAKYIALAVGLLLSIGAIVFAMRFTGNRMEELKKWAVLTVIAVASIIVLTTVIKYIWGRQRYIYVIGEKALFTPWYKPNGLTGGTSFPSGHTALFGTIYMLIPLMGVLGYKGEIFSYILIALTNALIGVFRIIGGYHYLSDVVFSMLLSFVVCFIVTRVGYDKDYSNGTLKERNIFRKI